jgi:uncharacterized membrane protein
MTSVRLQPLALLVPLLVAGTALACPDCVTARVVRASILGDHFWTYLRLALVPVLRTPRHQGAILSAGTLLGTGMGGFFDGILLHQILQWHNMLSSRLPPTDLVTMKVNMVWDGLFHAFTWLMTAIGLGLLWRAGGRPEVPWSTRTFVGSLSLGWGLFNVVEGVIDHQLLGIHHVHQGANQLAWDLGFLAFGALLIVLGLTLVRAGREDTRPRGVAVPPPGRVAYGRT